MAKSVVRVIEKNLRSQSYGHGRQFRDRRRAPHFCLSLVHLGLSINSLRLSGSAGMVDMISARKPAT